MPEYSTKRQLGPHVLKPNKRIPYTTSILTFQCAKSEINMRWCTFWWLAYTNSFGDTWRATVLHLRSCFIKCLYPTTSENCGSVTKSTSVNDTLFRTDRKNRRETTAILPQQVMPYQKKANKIFCLFSTLNMVKFLFFPLIFAILFVWMS